jgi:muconate cycloisomerase
MKIDRLDVFPLRYPMAGFFKFFAGAHGAEGRAAVIVKVTADDGTVGWGQSVPIEKWSYETLEAATIAIRDYYAPALIGHDPVDIAGAHRIMDETIHRPPSPQRLAWPMSVSMSWKRRSDPTRSPVIRP